ncbi:MAG: Uma2 family endonuclease [Chloroflexota bacterium]|nr:Uma2 family endonuclease [Chloroflexota bacterium]
MARPVIEPAHAGERRLPMTYEEFQAWEDEGRHGEWVDGEVIVFMPPTDRHQALAFWLGRLLAFFADLFDLGEVRVAPLEMRARPGGPAREPDVLFVAREHLDRLTPARLVGPADLVIEVVSPDSVTRDRVDKLAEYQEAGVREYWIVDSGSGQERADFYQLGADGKYRAVPPDADGYYRSAALPGFRLRHDWLRQNPLPKPLTLMKEIAPQALRAEVRASEDADGKA